MKPRVAAPRGAWRPAGGESLCPCVAGRAWPHPCGPPALPETVTVVVAVALAVAMWGQGCLLQGAGLGGCWHSCSRVSSHTGPSQSFRPALELLEALSVPGTRGERWDPCATLLWCDRTHGACWQHLTCLRQGVPSTGNASVYHEGPPQALHWGPAHPTPAPSPLATVASLSPVPGAVPPGWERGGPVPALREMPACPRFPSLSNGG